MKPKLLLVALVLFIFSCETTSETEVLNDGNLITSFAVQSGNLTADVQINGTEVEVFIPHDFDLTQVLLNLAVSQGAEISPNPSSITSLIDPIKFTITAENGDQRIYTITIVTEKSPENEMLSFIILDEATEIEAEIDQENNTVKYLFPHTWDLSQTTTKITISEKATISPDPDEVFDYSEPVVYTITAENGETRDYEVDLERELSAENEILSFTILNSPMNLEADIDQENGQINQKLPFGIDLTQIQVALTISENANINPDPETVMDYTNPVLFTVTSENEEAKEYTVTLLPMSDAVYINCDIDNASKWFGGDKRAYEVDPEYYFEPRNVGTGQGILPTKDLNLTSFSIHFRGQFETTYLPYKVYEGDLEIKLHLRNVEGEILATASSIVQSPITTSLWVKFDLVSFNLLLKKDETYYLTWYLVDGEELGIYNGTTGNQNEHTGECNGIGLTGTSKILYETHLDNWDTWGEHPWHFNFRLEGYE